MVCRSCLLIVKKRDLSGTQEQTQRQGNRDFIVFFIIQSSLPNLERVSVRTLEVSAFIKVEIVWGLASLGPKELSAIEVRLQLSN